MALKPLMSYTLDKLNNIGFNPYQQNARTKLQSFALIFITVITFTDIGLNCMMNWNGVYSMEEITLMLSSYQVIVKFTAMKLHRNDIQLIMEDFKKFFSLKKCSYENQQQLKKTSRVTKTSITLLLIIMSSALAAFAFRPFFVTKPNSLPYASCWLHRFTQPPWYQLAWIYQIVVIFPMITILNVFDSLYVCLIVIIISELKLLKEEFGDVSINLNTVGSDEKAMKELKKLIDHHNLILRCITTLKNIVSLAFLNTFACNTIMIGACLMCIVITGAFQNMEYFMSYLIFIIFYTSQLFMYCAPGSKLTSQCQEISDEIYNTIWWAKTQPELRKTYVMIIQRANKPEILKAGGVFYVNLETVRAVLKSSLSLFTFMQAVYRDSRKV